jgi:hypothetical protein
MNADASPHPVHSWISPSHPGGPEMQKAPAPDEPEAGAKFLEAGSGMGRYGLSGRGYSAFTATVS